MKKVLIGFAFLGVVQISAAQALVSPTVTSANMGWGGEGFYLNIAETVTSQGCSITNEIVLDGTNARFKESMAIILTAISMGKNPRLWVQGCYNNRSKIISAGIDN